MAEPDGEQQAQPGKWQWQFFVAVGLLVGFAGLVVAMLFLAKVGETMWQRQVYVFGAVEAVVFTAVGWVFGREVSRSAVQSAVDDAQRSKADSIAARERADTALVNANQAEVRAAVERTRGMAIGAAARHLAIGAVGESGPSDVAATEGSGLDAFVDELYRGTN